MNGTISGTVNREGAAPSSGLTVQAHNRAGLRNSAPLGEAVTDRSGSYSISYDITPSRDPERRQLNLLVRVFDSEGAALAESETLFDAGDDARIDISIPAVPRVQSEYERLRSSLTPYLSRADLREVGDTDLSFLIGASRGDGSQIETLRQADRFAETSELSSDLLYAVFREGLAPDEDGLFDPDAFTAAVERAVRAGTISERARSSLDSATRRLRDRQAARTASRLATYPSYLAVGKLLDEESGDPLAGYTVRVLDPAVDPPAELGIDISNSQGLFGVSYRLPPGTPEDETGRTLRVEVLDDEGQIIHTLDDVAVSGNPADVFEVRMRVAVPAPPDSPAIRELGLDLPSALADFLSAKSFETLADIRAAGGVALADGLPVPADDPVVLALDAHADLDRVSSNVEVSKALMAEGITSIGKLASAPRTRIVGLAHEKLGDMKAYEMQVAAKARAAVASNALAEYRLARASGRETASETTSELLRRVVSSECGCDDCESAVSPLAYLADLLNYALDHVENDGNPIDLGFLETTFLQPFSKLPADCEAMDESVRQVRLCIEVLRRYLVDNDLPATAHAKASLAKAESAYRLDTYQTLLGRIGTSYEDLRNARTATQDARRTLADRLGIAVAQLDELFLAILARPAQLTEAALETLFGLVDTTRDPLQDGPRPRLEEWRQEHLRTLWHEQDWPEDAYSDGTLPIIDPDLIGPDDFRAPYAKANAADSDRPFDVWLRRRGEVDTLLDEMRAAREDQGLTSVVAQELGVSLEELALLLTDLREGSASQRQAAEQMLGELHVAGEALARLLEIADKAASQEDVEAAAVSPEEWVEADSILAQARKQRELYTPWRQEEESLGLRIDPRLFWPTVREPIEGTWPPALVPAIPLIDPELLDRKQLPEPTAGALAHAIWESRRKQRDALDRALEQAHATMEGDTVAQMDALLRQALGDPDPGDPLPAGVDVELLLENLQSPDATLVDAAQHTIVGELRMSVESFKRLMAIRALADPAPEAWSEVYAILARAEKEKRSYPVWVAEEESAGLREQYWLALEAPLPRWRASYQARAVWRQSLGRRSDRPLIDPDLIGPADVHEPEIGQAAFDLWNERREDFVVAGLASLEQERESHANPLAGFDAVLLSSLCDTGNDLAHLHALVQTARESFGLSTALTMVWGASHADLDALFAALQDASTEVQAPARRTVIERLCVTPDEFAVLMAVRAQNEAAVSDAQWDQVYEVLAHAALLRSVVDLSDARARGEDIHPRLAQLGLPLDAFTMLARMRGLLAGDAILLNEEWSDVDSILLQARKRRLFGTWRSAEHAADIFLSPDIFKLPVRLPLTIPPLEPPPLPRWRSSRRDRADWLDRLESRVEQDASVVTALKQAVSDAEEAVLPALRHALILAASPTNMRGGIASMAKSLGDRLLIDTRTDGCARTTRIAQAIETIQGILWSLRNRLLDDTYPDLDLEDDDFDEAWEWIGSYVTWRTAVFVFLYPENILAPQLRRHQTPAFRQLVGELRGDRRLTPDRALEYARRYSGYFSDVTGLKAEASCQTRVRVYEDGVAKHYAYKLFVFARGGQTGTPYWCAFDPDDKSGYAQSFWTEIPGFGRVIRLIGAAPYERAEDTRHIYLFAETIEKGEGKLVFVRFNLELNSWEGEATELELLDDSGHFDAVAIIRQRENVTPDLLIRRKDGAIFRRRLHSNGDDWDEAGWDLVLGYAKGRDFGLRACIEIDPDNFCLIVAGPEGAILYRVYGDRDDGQWRQVGQGKFLGAELKAGATIHVWFRSADGVVNHNAFLSTPTFGNLTVDSPEELHQWLLDTAGASLKDVRFSKGQAFDLGLPLAIVGENTIYDVLVNPGDYIHGDMGQNEVFGGDEEQLREIAISWLSTHAKNTRDQGDWTDPVYGPWGRVVSHIGKLQTYSDGEVGVWQVLTEIFREGNTISFRERAGDGILALAATAGLERVLASSGTVPGGKPRFAVLQRGGSHRGLSLRGFDVLPVPLAPTSATFTFSPDLSEAALQMRRQKIGKTFADNEGASAALRTYLEEAFYGVPMILGASLSARGHYTGALDWYRSVYDYSAPPARRVIYTPLDAARRALPFGRAEDWLLDPLDPHAIADNRGGAHKRFTVLSICGCLLNYADAEFSRDTAESVPRARLLYDAVLDLLDSPELKQQIRHCAEIIGTLNITVGDPYWVPAVQGVKAQLAEIGDVAVLEQTAQQVSAVLSTSETWAARIASARAIVADALSAQAARSDVESVLSEGARRTVMAARALETDSDVVHTSARVAARSVQAARDSLSLVTGIRSDALEAIDIPSLRAKLRTDTDDANGGPPGRTVDPSISRPDFAGLSRYNPLAPSRTATLAQWAQADPIRAVKLIEGRRRGSFVPAPSFSFCIPRNPVLKALRLRAELNLYKIRTCRNIAGMLRELEPYAAPTDTVSGLPTIGAGGQLVLPGLNVLEPTPYRYPVLIERARQLTGLAQQIEAAMLASIEKGDAERYSVLKARQDVQMATGGVRLQTLRVREAASGVKLAELQQESAEIRANHFAELLSAGVSLLEEMQLRLLVISGAQKIGASAAAAGTFNVSEAMSIAAESTALAATVTGLYADFERRAQDWQFQKTLAEQEIRVGAQQVKVAEDHVRVVEQERVIAELQLDHAKDVVEFLVNKFTSVELYDWMGDVLEGVYSFFLQQATATAQLAGSQLAFERQEASPPIIQADYWEAPADYFGSGEDGKAPDRRGLTGSARLLQDIHRLDQYAFDTDQRKLQLTKTISLARLAPAEFQRFRESGVMIFATPMTMFDRDFPGHYLRLVKRVRTSIIALIPPAQGIHATLSTTGTSRVVIGGDIFQTVVVNHGPQSVALTSPMNATGLFELDTQPEMLLPYEGLGVDTTWEFRLPKAANLFDYSTIADVLVTIEYTALNSYDYRSTVIQELDGTLSADRGFSFRHQFADQWYDLHNPKQTATPMVVRFRTRREDFPPNLEALRIQHAVLYFARTDGATFEVPVTYLRFTDEDEGGPVGGGATSIDGIISTRKGNAASWTAMLGKAPFGEWELALLTPLIDGRKPSELFAAEQLDDVLLVVTYSARLPQWPH